MSTSIHFHPSISRTAAGPYITGEQEVELVNSRRSWYLGSMDQHLAKLELLEHLDTTRPSCRAVGMRIRTFLQYKETSTECIVYNADGVEVRDLIAVARALLVQEGLLGSKLLFGAYVEVVVRIAT